MDAATKTPSNVGKCECECAKHLAAMTEYASQLEDKEERLRADLHEEQTETKHLKEQMKDDGEGWMDGIKSVERINDALRKRIWKLEARVRMQEAMIATLTPRA
eukprot:gene17270-1893_t